MERIEKRKNPDGYPKTTFHDDDTHKSPELDDMSSLSNSFTPRRPPRNIKKDIPVSPLTPNTPVDKPKPPKGPYPGTNRPMPLQLKLPEIQNKSNKKPKNNGGKKKTKKTKKILKKKNKTNKRKHKKRNTRKK